MLATRRALLAAQGLAALAIVALAWTVLGRLGVDAELEWMTGSFLDHVERVRAGKPIYTPPSIDWTPFLYPPLYYELLAKLAGIGKPLLAGRLVSIAATVVQGVCVWHLAGKHGASRPWQVIGLGFFTGAFAITSFWYDVERVDSLFVALMAVSVTVLAASERLVTTAIAALVMALGFFAKQPAAMFILGAVFALAATKQWKRATIFAALAFAVVGVGVARLEASTGGWFGYYVLKMPGRHGIVPSLFKQLFLDDAPRAFALVAGSAFVVGRWARGRLRGDRESDRQAVFACAIGAAAIAAGSARVHLGGWENVLMPFTTFGAAAAAVAGTALTERWKSGPASALVPVAAFVQMLIWAYNPASCIPSRRELEGAARALEVRVGELERQGEVVVLGRGHVTTPRHAHLAAIVDVFRAERDVTPELARPFRERKYAAVVIDGFEDLFLSFTPFLEARFFSVVAANYYIAEQLPGGRPGAPVGYPTQPRLVLRPRKERLAEDAHELLRCLAKVERGIAEARERAERGGGRATREPDGEAIARDACAAGLAGAAPPRGAPRVPDDDGWR